MKYNVEIREVSKTLYFWYCPECKIEQSSNTRPYNDYLVCPKCLEKENTKDNQEALEKLLLRAKVVRVESALIAPYCSSEEDLQKLRKITLLCSDDETLIHIKAPSHEWEDEYDEMSLEIEKIDRKRTRK
jgi:hypothetical protein